MVLKRLLILPLLLLLLSSTAFATVQYDTSAKGATTWGSTKIVSITVGSNDNRILVVGVDGERSGGGYSCTGVTYNGDPLDEITTGYQNSFRTVSLWYMEAPDTGTHNVEVTMSSTSNIRVGVISIYDADQDAPEASGKDTGSGTNPTVSLSSVTNGAMIVDIVQNDDSGADQTTGSDERWEESYRSRANGATKSSSGGTDGISWTIGTTETWRNIQAAFAPVGGGGEAERRIMIEH